MKVNLQQALTGKSLRNDIFNTIGNRSLHSLSALLRRSRQRESRYLPYSSQHTLLQGDSPIRQADLSNPLSASPPHWLGRPNKGREAGVVGVAGKIQRMRGREGLTSKSKNKSTNKSASKHPPSKANRGTSKRKSHEKAQGHSQSPSKSKNNASSRGKSNESNPRKSTSSKRSHKSKLDLSSIIEHSRQRVVTPSSRGNSRREKSRRSAEKTHKKARKEELPQSICKRIQRLSREPTKFLRVMKNELLSIRVRVQRRKIIEIEVLTHKQLPRLTVALERGNLDCQHVEERYLAVPASSRLALFSCVRAIDLDRPCVLPRLQIEVTMDDGTIIDRYATIPYTWLLFASEGRPHPKSRIVTKACLEDATIDPVRLRALTLALPGWSSRHNRGESMLCSQFNIGDESLSFVGREIGGAWSLEVVGRGQSRLQGLLAFLSAFLRS